MAMATSKILLFLHFFLIHLVFTSISQPNFGDHSCSETGNYTANSVYKNNLDNLLSAIASDTQIDYGFYNQSSGQEPDRVNAIALCRGDLTVDKCRSCVNDSTREILRVCPVQKAAIGWYDECLLRYSNQSIYGVTENGLLRARVTSQKATDFIGFNQALRTLLDQLRIEAKSGSLIRKFATGESRLQAPSFDTIYALVQCSPDLSAIDCDGCLSQLASFIPSCCNASVNVRIYTPSCILQYGISLFYNPPPPPPPPRPPPTTPPPTEEANNSNTTRTIIIIVVSIVAVVLLAIAICIFWRMRKQKHKKPSEKAESVPFRESTDEISTVETLQFEFDHIRTATADFSIENKLGQGGFGAVYRGRLANGQDIAVKRLSADSGQGDLEFKNEVLLVAKLQHRNLVRLLGFSIQGNERLLIYEFLPNASLDHFIFDPAKRPLLDWSIRYKIIHGIARGLLYLHEDSRLRIIHRDLKASNILLDGEMNPKIGDFGMARLFEVDETQGNTSRIVGTYGYMAPEYAMHGQFSIKSDVFSFGVLVLEIVSGQKNNCFRSGKNVEDLLSSAWKKWKAKASSDIIDPKLNSGSRNEMTRCIHIGLLCTQENAADRPTMASVVLMLNSHSLSLPLPSEPAFFIHSSIDEASISSNTDRRSRIQASDNEAAISAVFPR